MSVLQMNPYAPEKTIEYQDWFTPGGVLSPNTTINAQQFTGRQTWLLRFANFRKFPDHNVL